MQTLTRMAASLDINQKGLPYPDSFKTCG